MQKALLKDLRLLYVEDEEDVRRSAVEYLKRIVKEVYKAKDGKEAISVWHVKKPDINMPRLNGLDMARYIRSKDQDVQIIIATAYTDTEYLMQAIELNLVKYLAKPITKEKLLKALGQSLNKIKDQKKFSVQLSRECSYNAYTQTITYQKIEDAIWPLEGMSQDAIRSLVRGVRKKVPDGAIENVSGVGYRLKIHPR